MKKFDARLYCKATHTKMHTCKAGFVVVKSMPRASLSRPSTRDNARSMKTHLCDKNSQVQLVINCTPKQPMSFAIQNQAVE